MIKLIGESLQQWDTDRFVEVTEGVEEVHFSNCHCETALVVGVKDGQAEIPNILLQEDQHIRAWAVAYSENGERSVDECRFRVTSKQKPVDYEYKPTATRSYSALEKRIEALEKGGVSGGGLTEESDPTVPEWAKQPEKPTYTAEDITYGESNVGEKLGQLSEQKVDNPSTGEVGQILEIETVDENGKPKTYKAVDKPQGGGSVETVVTESRLKGHTMGVIGDSLSDRSRQVTQWFDWIASRVGGMNLSLDCVSGRRLMQFPSDGLSEQCDIICVFGGTNDFNSAQPIGTLESANTDGTATFYGAVYKLATELMTNYPKAQIIFITPLSSAPAYNSSENYEWYEYPMMGGHTVKDFADAIKDVCGWLHIPVVDLFTNSGLNYNYDVGFNFFVSDKLHLTSLGQEVISYVIEDEILRHYIPDNSTTGSVVVLTSIEAVFTQGDTIITTDYSLSQLKEMLVVTAHKSDGTTEIVDSYSLSGELTEGTSTITVNYLGKTDTFDVVVSASGIAFEPFVVTLTPDTTLGKGVYFIPNGTGELISTYPDGDTNTGVKNAIYSELVGIKGATNISADSNNVTYTWTKLYSVDDDKFGANIVFYDTDMNITGYGIPMSSYEYYNQYPTKDTYSSVGFGWIATDENGIVVTELNKTPTVPENTEWMRVLLPNSTITTNTLTIS